MKNLVKMLVLVLFVSTFSVSVSAQTQMWSLKDSIKSIKINAKLDSVPSKIVNQIIKNLKVAWLDEYTNGVSLPDGFSAENKKGIKDEIIKVAPSIKTIEMVSISSDSDFDRIIIFDGQSLKICYSEYNIYDGIYNFIIYMNYLNKNNFKVEYLKINYGLALIFYGEIDNFVVNMTINNVDKFDIVNNYLKLNKLGVNKIKFSRKYDKKFVTEKGKKVLYCGNPRELQQIFPSEIQ